MTDSSDADESLRRLAGQIREVGRRRDLGIDPAAGQYRGVEEEAAIRLERLVGTLKRDPSGTADWIDAAGRSYDAVGPVPVGKFVLGSFTRQIERHLLKQGLDRVVVDLTNRTPAEAEAVEEFMGTLSIAQRNRIIKII